MAGRFDRTKMLLGREAIEKLKKAHVALFGVGGVGGYAAEALVRSGIGTIDLIDADTVDITNLNRQIIALTSTIGRYKTEVMAERLRDINPEVRVIEHRCFFLPENADAIDFTQFDYILDAVDTVAAKVEIAVRAKNTGVPVISAMGAGNRLDPTAFTVTDIFKTQGDPLAKVMRHELRARGIGSLKVVFSTEAPRSSGGRTPGSAAFVPSVAGLVMAGEVIKDLYEYCE